MYSEQSGCTSPAFKAHPAHIKRQAFCYCALVDCSDSNAQPEEPEAPYDQRNGYGDGVNGQRHRLTVSLGGVAEQSQTVIEGQIPPNLG